MADEQEPVPVTVPEGQVVPEVVEPEPEVTHPLEPGGQRFSEVYRDMQDARRETARLQGELDAYRRQSPPQSQQPQFYTPQQLQGEVDNGHITPAVMTAQIAWQERQIAKQEMRQEFSQAEHARGAGAEIQRYVDMIPKLGDVGSDEFRRVDRVNREMAGEMGLPLDDLRVQRRALQIVYGPVDRLTKSKAASEATRTHSDTYVESGAGGGGVKPKLSTDPLKDVPATYMKHWERLGYTREQMVEESKFIRPTPRARAGLWKP